MDRLTLSLRRRRWFVAAALALPILSVGAPYLFTSRNLSGVDWIACYRPHALLAQESLRETGELPRWNPYLYAGTPLLGSLQHNFYYPPNALFLVFSVDRAYGWIVTLHQLVAAWGMYRLARIFKLARIGCVIAGLSYSLSFCLIARVFAGHITHLFVLSLAPMTLYALLQTLARPTVLHLLPLAGCVALVLLAGHPQAIYHLLLLCAASAIWKLIERRKENWVASGGAMAGAVVIGIAVAAVQLFPSWEVARESTRGLREMSRMDDYESMSPRDLISFVYPESASLLWHEKAAYLGIVPLFLAAFAFAGSRPIAVWFFVVAGALMLLDSMARVLPLHSYLTHLPGYGSFRIPARSAWIAVLALSVLAAFGWDAAARRVTRPLILGIAAGGLTAIDLGFHALRVERTIDRVPEPWYASAIESPELARLLDLTDTSAAPVARHFRLLNGHGYPLLRSTPEFYGRAWLYYVGPNVGPTPNELSHGGRLKDSSILDRLNVRWFVLGDVDPDPRWREVVRSHAGVLYENPNCRPFAVFADGDEAMDWTRPSPNRIDVQCRTARPRSLVVSEAWAPGWRATVNGESVPVQREEEALLKVDVPAGESHVKFVYDPKSWRVGRLISASGLGMMLILAAWGVARRYA